MNCLKYRQFIFMKCSRKLQALLCDGSEDIYSCCAPPPPPAARLTLTIYNCLSSRVSAAGSLSCASLRCMPPSVCLDRCPFPKRHVLLFLNAPDPSFLKLPFCLLWWGYCTLLSCMLSRPQCNLACAIFSHECMHKGMAMA